jgi:hypothetical protein
MGLFSKRDDNTHGDWEARVTKAPRWSAGRGTYNGFVNGDEVVSNATTRRGARQGARREARRRHQEDLDHGW